MSKTRYSRDVDALLIELSDKPIDYAEEAGQVIAHFAADGEPVLLEILDARDFLLRSFSKVLKEAVSSRACPRFKEHRFPRSHTRRSAGFRGRGSPRPELLRSGPDGAGSSVTAAPSRPWSYHPRLPWRRGFRR